MLWHVTCDCRRRCGVTQVAASTGSSACTQNKTAMHAAVTAATIVTSPARALCAGVCRWQASGCTALMVGRGALIKPWLFQEIREVRPWYSQLSDKSGCWSVPDIDCTLIAWLMLCTAATTLAATLLSAASTVWQCHMWSPLIGKRWWRLTSVYRPVFVPPAGPRAAANSSRACWHLQAACFIHEGAAEAW